MALAVGTLPHVHNLDLSVMSHQDIEGHAENLEMLSLIVLTNHVRPDSKPAIEELQDQ